MKKMLQLSVWCNFVTSKLQTISRTSRKSRPTSVAAFREHEKESESENESEDTQTRTVLSDIMDFGVDIFADQGWDTDLEGEGMCEVWYDLKQYVALVCV